MAMTLIDAIVARGFIYCPHCGFELAPEMWDGEKLCFVDDDPSGQWTCDCGFEFVLETIQKKIVLSNVGQRS